MAQADPADEGAGGRIRPKRRIWRWVLLVPLILLALALASTWIGRETIADNVIGRALASREVRATYTVEQVGPRRQVLTNVVVGDPRNPDLTIERAEVLIRLRFGYPTIEEVRLHAPRLRGRFRGGTLSFGALDPLLFTGREEPLALPDLPLRIENGQTRLETDYGAVRITLTGRGNLRDGFSGQLAANAPEVVLGGCRLTRTALSGRIAIEDERPRFSGPVRVAQLGCEDSGLSVSDAAIELAAHGDRTFKGFEGEGRFASGALRLGSSRAASTRGEAGFTWRDQGLTARYDLAASKVITPQAALARLDLEGSLRARRGFERFEFLGEARGAGLHPGPALDRGLAGAAEGTRGTLLNPLIGRVRSALHREAPGSTFAADYIVRRTGKSVSLVVPQARLRGSSGATLLALSRLQLGGGTALPRFSVNLTTGGKGLPRIAGRMEGSADGSARFRLTMPEYSAGDAQVRVPQMEIAQGADGALGFAGRIEASGPLPGGRAEGLRLPVSGSWGPQDGLRMWSGCTDLQFDSLSYANLTLDRRSLRLCAPRGRPILRYGAAGLDLAAETPSLEVSGRLGETPIRATSGAVAFALPGVFSAQNLRVALGPTETAAHFAVDDLSARVGSTVGGEFAGADVTLYGVPLDILRASGGWRYQEGRLLLTDGSFRLEDREGQDRFEPLVATGATLTLADNLIAAEALLRAPTNGRGVVLAGLRHSLLTGAGRADLRVDSLRFDSELQPAQLSTLALGVVANVAGEVSGTGRINWNEEGVTSSGRFSSRAIDFAAPFGPVKGASGTIVFTDLLGLTTAPGQVVHIASVNPGIEASNGEIAIQLTDGRELTLRGGTWPFSGGILRLHPVTLTLGADEVRRYVLEVEGLDAGLFVQRMELGNLSTSGIFDGTIPLVFDKDGGRVDNGLLVSRPPGGNLSYVGELTYEDLSPIANFAFDALRSLDYRKMSIQLDGSLAGEVITRVRFDGVSQGAGTRRNFITRRLAKLPFQFDVNIRAPFYSLITSMKAMYDPASIRDPRELGLVDAQGRPLPEGTRGVAVPQDEAAIQPSESENSR